MFVTHLGAFIGCVPAWYSIAWIQVLPSCCAFILDMDMQVTYGLHGLDTSVGHMLYICSCVWCSICFVQWCCGWSRQVLTIYCVCIQAVPLVICHTLLSVQTHGLFGCSLSALSAPLAVCCTLCCCPDMFIHVADMLYICTQYTIVCMRYVCTLFSGSCSLQTVSVPGA